MITTIIPAAGKGSRFNGKCKVLIPVNDSYMLHEAIRTFGNVDSLHYVVVQSTVLSQLNDLTKLSKSINLIGIDYYTSGPSTTALLLQDKIDADSELIIYNCDQLMNWDVNAFLEHARKFDGCIVTYSNNEAKNSFAKIQDEIVTEIREKEVISDSALVGIHYWKCASDFFSSARLQQEDNATSCGEFYISTTYNYLIKSGKQIGTYHLVDSQCTLIGTPKDLEDYNETR